MDLGNNLQLLYTSRQVVAIVLPPNSAPIPVALVELQEDVICRVDGSTAVFTQPSYAGKELVELESEAHVYERAGGTCRVAGANISTAVRMAKMHMNNKIVVELDADEWDRHPCAADARGVATYLKHQTCSTVYMLGLHFVVARRPNRGGGELSAIEHMGYE
jgi:hypothetical protein